MRCLWIILLALVSSGVFANEAKDQSRLQVYGIVLGESESALVEKCVQNQVEVEAIGPNLLLDGSLTKNPDVETTLAELENGKVVRILVTFKKGVAVAEVAREMTASPMYKFKSWKTEDGRGRYEFQIDFPLLPDVRVVLLEKTETRSATVKFSPAE